MKDNVKIILEDFVKGKLNVDQFRDIMEEWNQSGALWEGLSESDYKLISSYFYVYFDRYYGVEAPKLSAWGRIKKSFHGELYMDLQDLKKGTGKLLEDLQWS